MTHDRSVVVGMKSSQLLVINFPLAVFTSPDTHNMAAMVRLLDTDSHLDTGNHLEESIPCDHNSEDIRNIYNLPYNEQMWLLVFMNSFEEGQ